MYALEFDTVSKDGYICIPQEYKEELDNRKDIRLVVMYDIPSQKSNELNVINDELKELEKLFSNSDNQIVAAKSNAIDTDEMINDIS